MEVDGIGGFSLVPPGKRGDVNPPKPATPAGKGGSEPTPADFRGSPLLNRLKAAAAASRHALDPRADVVARARERLRSGALDTPEAVRAAAANLIAEERRTR